MNIKIICAGKLKEAYLRDACAEYLKRLSSFANMSVIEVDDDEKIKEGKRLLAKINERDFVIALDIFGESLSSEEFSQKLANIMQKGAAAIDFVIGGSLGLSEEILARANMRLSFSRMTFPHQLMRVILLEQIYRAAQIMRGTPYHK